VGNGALCSRVHPRSDHQTRVQGTRAGLRASTQKTADGLIALLGIAFLTPLVYFGSKNYQFQALYPLVLNAGNSPAAFVKSAFFYFLYYVGYEFCFRGFLFMGIKDDIGDWQALGVSLIATVLLHVSQPQAEMIMAVFAGVAFPLIVKKMRTIWPVVFIHAYAGIALDYWIIMARGGFSYT
jgi:membrane protease YdiL (CAAX protease family)